jgi:hypothetical protein
MKEDEGKAVVAQQWIYFGFEVAILEATAGMIARCRRCRQLADEVHLVLSFSHVGCCCVTGLKGLGKSSRHVCTYGVMGGLLARSKGLSSGCNIQNES